MILKFIWKCKEPKTSKITLEKKQNKVEEYDYLIFKIYYQAKVMKQWASKDRQSME